MDASTTRTWARHAFLTLAGAGFLAACATGGQDVAVETESSGGGGTVPRSSVDQLPQGMEMTAELDSRLSVEESQAGDGFHATIVEPVLINGAVAVPEGTLIRGEVTAVHSADDEERPNVIVIDFTRMEIAGEAYPLDADLIEASPTNSDGETLEKAGIGAAAGAVIGGVLSENVKGALIGAGVGAAAGTAVALGSQGEPGVLERGSQLRLRLTEMVDLDRPLR